MYVLLNENVWILITISLKFVPIWQYSSTGSDNGMAPNRRQAIIWINADPIHWRIYAAIGEDELILFLGAQLQYTKIALIARFMGPKWDPPGSCRPQVGPM